MGDLSGALIVGGAVAGVAWLYQQEQQRRQAAETATVQPAVYTPTTSDNGRGDLFGAMLGLIGSQILDGNNSNSGSGGLPEVNPENSSVSGLIGSLFGQFGIGGSGGGGAGGSVAGSASVYPILDVIGRAEAPGGYNTVYAGSRIQPPRPITTMSVGEVEDWQVRSVAAGSASSAVGRYQIILSTLRSLITQGTLARDELFGTAAQDRAAVALMRRRGLDSYRRGQITAEQFANNLAREWAGLPLVSGSNRGRSYYAGDGLNAATVAPETILNAINSVGVVV